VRRRALAALSGGVDSAYAAWALKQAGDEVIGIHLVMGDFGPGDGVPRCCSTEDAADARRVAEFLDIPFYRVNAREEFRREVLTPFAAAYARGLTPNPCVLCNPGVKWAVLARMAAELGACAIATGHYARVVKTPGPAGAARLFVGRERRKEQSYFLALLEPGQLALAEFPAGELQKAEVRAAVAAAGLPVAGKAESQDVCFVEPGGYAATVERLLPEPPRPGEVVDLSGRRLGGHRGVHHFTIGQRKGVGVAGPEPLYVVAIDAERARVTLGPRAACLAARAEVEGLRWLSAPESGERLTVKVRYRSASAPCVLDWADGRGEVRFDEPQRAVAPGQAAVFYRGDEVLGGGVLARAGS